MLLRIVSLLLVLALAVGAVGMYAYSYAEFVDFVLAWANKSHWRSTFTATFFPPARFILFRQSVAITTIAAGLSLVLFWRRLPALQHTISYQYWWLSAALRRSIQAPSEATRKEQYIFYTCLGIFSLYSLWDMWRLPLQYDEAWTYNHFVHTGPFVGGLSPNNNHILFTHLAFFTKWLPLPIELAYRLPSWIGVSLAACVFWRSSWAVGGRYFAYIASMLFLFAPVTHMFAVLARSYGLLFLWTAYLLALLWKMYTRTYWPTYYFVGLAGLIFLGLYSNIAFIYILVGLSPAILSLLLRYRKHRAALVAALCGGVLLWALANLPHFLVNSARDWLEAGTPQETVSLSKILQFTQYLADWMAFGQHHTAAGWIWLSLLFLGGSIVFLRFSRATYGFWLGLCSLLFFPVWVYGLTGVPTPPRIWNVLILPWAWLLAASLAPLARYLPQKIQYLTVLLGGAYGLYASSTHYDFCWSRTYDIQNKTLAAQLAHQQVHTLYYLGRYDKPALLFYSHHYGQPLSIALPFPESVDFQPISQQNKFEVVLWEYELHPDLPAPDTAYWLLTQDNGRQRVFFPKK